MEFVKIGSVSVRGVQRTANVCESDTLPENCTLEMIRKNAAGRKLLPAAHAKNGKSAYETIETWWKEKRVIAPMSKRIALILALMQTDSPQWKAQQSVNVVV